MKRSSAQKVHTQHEKTKFNHYELNMTIVYMDRLKKAPNKKQFQN